MTVQQGRALRDVGWAATGASGPAGEVVLLGTLMSGGRSFGLGGLPGNTLPR